MHITLKDYFFDTEKVQRAIGAAAAKALSRFGAYVRQRDKTSIKYETGKRKKSSPGQPPVGHRSKSFKRKKRNRKTGQVTIQPASPLRELIQFAYEPSNQSVIIGPELFRQSKIGGGKAPRVIEEGGIGQYVDHGKLKTAHFAARPHTLPAFKAELPKAPALFAGQVK